MSVLHVCRSCGLPMDDGLPGLGVAAPLCDNCSAVDLYRRIIEVADREADAIRAMVRALPPRPPETGTTWAEVDPLMLTHGGGP